MRVTERKAVDNLGKSSRFLGIRRGKRGDLIPARPDAGDGFPLRFELLEKFDFAVAQRNKFTEYFTGTCLSQILHH